jgi:ribosomal protein L17
MQLEYVATNRIPVSSQKDINEYLKLCGLFFDANITNPEMTPITEGIQKTLIDGAKSLYETFKGNSPLENLNVVHYGSLGFASQIDYDKSQRSFKLKLFADRKLKERGLDSTYEPMRHLLTSGPIQLGLKPVREVEDGVEVPKQDFSFEDLEKHQIDVLNGELKYYSEEAKRELKPPKDYDDWLWGDVDEHRAAMSEEIEEYLFEKEQMEKAENTSKALKKITDYLGKTSFINKLKNHSKLFADMRKDFAKRFPAKSEVFENTALGVLPWFHRNHMVGSFGTLLDDKEYIPSFKQGGFEDGRANFMEAEIWVPPQSNYCRRIVSLFPYTHLHITEFNQLQEEFCDDAEVIQAMFGHELGEIVLEDEVKPIQVNPLHLLLNSPEVREYEEEERRQTESRHRKLDKLLADVGLGEQTKKMLKLYRDKGESLLPKYRHDYDTSEILEKVIKDLNEKI